jgi:hypothetical protein
MAHSSQIVDVSLVAFRFSCVCLDHRAVFSVFCVQVAIPEQPRLLLTFLNGNIQEKLDLHLIALKLFRPSLYRPRLTLLFGLGLKCVKRLVINFRLISNLR